MSKFKFRPFCIAALFALAAGLAFTSCDNMSVSKDTDDTTTTVTETPVAVTVKATAGDGQVTLSWTKPDVSTLSSYIVYQGTSSSDVSDKVASISDTSTTSYIVTELTNNTRYYFTVTAVYSDGTKKVSSVVNAKPVSATSSDDTTVSSVDFAANLVIGWNLGNTLDAGSTGSKTNQGTSTETSWGLPSTTQAMIKAVSDAGFKTIRIPVSWHNHITDSSYTIDSAWMARVKEIVDWAIDEGMYVIINIHHDNMQISQITAGTDYGYALSDDSDVVTESKSYLAAVWKQIATEFADYDNHLVFEVLNEPRDKEGEYASAHSLSNCSEWWTNNSDEIAIVTDYEQTCVDTIRSISGNENRFIMVPGYAASGSDNSMLALYTMPEDSADDKLILSGHAYSPYAFAMYSDSDTDHTTFTSSDKSSLDSIFSYLKTNYIDKGIGVVMGEASASDKDNLDERISWAEYYFTLAAQDSIPVIIWDNMVTISNGGSLTSGECHGYLNRNTCKWYFPTLVSAMIESAGGTANIDDSDADEEDDSSGTTLYSGSLDGSSWGSSTSISAGKFSSAAEGSTITFTTEACSNSTNTSKQIQLFNTSWSQYTALTGTFSGGTYDSGSITASASEGTVVWTLSSDDATTLQSGGLLLQPYGIKITKVVLSE